MDIQDTSKMLFRTLQQLEAVLPDHQIIIIARGYYDSDCKAAISANRSGQTLIDIIDETLQHVKRNEQQN